VTFLVPPKDKFAQIFRLDTPNVWDRNTNVSKKWWECTFKYLMPQNYHQRIDVEAIIWRNQSLSKLKTLEGNERNQEGLHLRQPTMECP
jgi:hypothetical protein